MSEDVRATAGEAAASLRAVVDVIDGGELAADEVQRAYLAGAADALAAVAASAAHWALR